MIISTLKVCFDHSFIALPNLQPSICIRRGSRKWTSNIEETLIIFKDGAKLSEHSFQRRFWFNFPGQIILKVHLGCPKRESTILKCLTSKTF